VRSNPFDLRTLPGERSLTSFLSRFSLEFVSVFFSHVKSDFSSAMKFGDLSLGWTNRGEGALAACGLRGPHFAHHLAVLLPRCSAFVNLRLSHEILSDRPVILPWANKTYAKQVPCRARASSPAFRPCRRNRGPLPRVFRDYFFESQKQQLLSPSPGRPTFPPGATEPRFRQNTE
jgi:hypothetical protein